MSEFGVNWVSGMVTFVEALELAQKGRLSEARERLAAGDEPEVEQKARERAPTLADVFWAACPSLAPREVKDAPGPVSSWWDEFVRSLGEGDD